MLKTESTHKIIIEVYFILKFTLLHEQPMAYEVLSHAN